MRTRPRHLVTIALGAVAVLAAAACQPYFGSDDTLTATPLGQLATLSWSAAQDDDPGETVTEYGIEVDGVEVSRFPAASGRSCILTGLAAGATYQLSVTAYGNTGEHSGNYLGDLASMARVTVPYTNATRGAPAGAARTCVAPTDTDGDRLPNALENGGGAFVSAAATGTNASNPDTDADGVRDGDEVLGTTSGIDLYAMGTRPTKKDLLFEFDWFTDAITCAPHSHQPSAAMLDRVRTAFAATPTANPDGSLGINVIGDYGQGAPFTGGNLIVDADGVLTSGVGSAEYLGLKAANFSPSREGLFHYVVLAHNYNTNSGSSGQAEIWGDDMIVSLQCSAQSTNAVGNTIMHEVGHNLGLRHGGNVETNNKPNYNSVMNYRYQFPGVDTNCLLGGDGLLAYSNGSRASLNENALLETNGLCNGVDIDWNRNGTIDAGGVVFDINRDRITDVGDGQTTTLNDFNDAANLCLTCVADGNGDPFDAEVSAPVIVDEQDTPPGLP